MAQSTITTNNSTSTKSIDVGSIFLMDMPINESEYNDNDSYDLGSWNSPINQQIFMPTRERAEARNDLHHNSAFLHQSNLERCMNDRSISDINQQQEKQNYHWQLSTTEGCSDSSTEQAGYRSSTSGLPELAEPQHSNVDVNSTTTASLLSVSDEDDSYAASSETSPCASFIVASACNSVPENEDKGSTTTREDSGVLDMKDLDGPLVNNSFYDGNDDVDQKLSQKQRLIQQKQRLQHGQNQTISTNDATATNLINSKEEARRSVDYPMQEFAKHHYHNRHSNEPTNDGITDSGVNNSNAGRQINNQQYDRQHYQQRGGGGGGGSHLSRRSVSASLPIQVPARQMKKGLNKMKLKLADENFDANDHQDNDPFVENDATSTSEKQLDHDTEHSNKRPTGRRRHATESSYIDQDVVDDVDEFLRQEYNDNHHNHYPIDELDEDQPRSPMKLFESIQALARSMHEDSQIFGSLPPKRMLESPIRSLAIV